MCDCGCTSTAVDCNCPPPVQMEGASLYQIVLNTGGGTPIDIYNSGNGYDTTIYTNTSTNVEYVTIESNMYVTSNSQHILQTIYKDGATNLDQYGTMKYNLAPIKTDLTHYMIGYSLGVGQSIKMNIKSSDSTARLQWITSNVYRFEI